MSIMYYGKRIRKKYTIGYGLCNWYVVNQITDMPSGRFNTRKEAREYMQKVQRGV